MRANGSILFKILKSKKPQIEIILYNIKHGRVGVSQLFRVDVPALAFGDSAAHRLQKGVRINP